MTKKPLRLVISGIVLLLASAALIGLAGYKNFQVEIDGQSRALKAFAWNVSDGLRAARVSLAEGDVLDPGAGQWLPHGGVIRIERAAQVAVLADGKLYHILTAERIPARILAQIPITLGPGDLLLASGNVISPQSALPNPGLAAPPPSLQVVRAVNFTVEHSGQTKELTSTAATVGQALWDNKIVLSEADPVTPGLGAELKPGLTVAYQASRQVTIHTAEADITRQTAAETVGQALAGAGLSLEGLDYSLPAENAPLPLDGEIQVVRVREETIIEQTALPYQVEFQPAEDLEIDNQKVLQAGEAGLTAKRIRVRYEDGKEVRRTVENEWIARPPQNQINGYGTKIVMHTLDTPDGTITYWRAVRMWATSYHPSETGSDETASGQRVRIGIVAVDRSLIPFYTQLYIPGYGPAIAADTGGGVIGRMIDLAYPDAEYVEWHQYVTVYFLWPPPANIVWILP